MSHYSSLYIIIFTQKLTIINFTVFARVIHALSKIGDEIYFEADANGVRIAIMLFIELTYKTQLVVILFLIRKPTSCQ